MNGPSRKCAYRACVVNTSDYVTTVQQSGCMFHGSTVHTPKFSTRLHTLLTNQIARILVGVVQHEEVGYV